MLKQEYRHLKKNGIFQLCQSSSEQQSIIVQVYNITVGKNDKISCFLSDGNSCVKVFLKEKNIIKPQKNQFSIIRVKNHVVGDSGKKLGIIDFEVICDYSKMIGNPKPIDTEHFQNPEEVGVYEIDAKGITNKYVNLQQQVKQQPLSRNTVNTSASKTIKKQQIKQQKKEMRLPVSAPKPLNGNVKDYETIKGLFIGLRGWHLLCRVTKLDFQQFPKKNTTDKIVKVLNIELMDRSQVKISGVFFYEAAQKFRDQLKLNSVYKISEGTIGNQSYNNSKNEKMSPFKLTFNINSVFEEVSDVHVIARPEDAAITLSELLNKPIYDQQYDIIGILVEIEQPVEINKGDKLLTRWNWVIVDPIQQKRIHAILWNNKLKPDNGLIGKTVILGRFTLHNYNGSLTLNSKARSTIQPVSYHSYQSMQQKSMDNYKSYQMLSQRRMKQQDNNLGDIYTNLKDLSDAIQNLPTGQTIKSDVEIKINRMMMKKWFYDGCPQCNKLAQKGTTCHCGKYVEETIPHFIMSVELSDAFGSIWATAYDDQAKRIFWNDEDAINKLIKLDQNQLKDIIEDYLFQQFRVRIYTKKDEQGRIKHNLGKLQVKPAQKIAQQNVQKIKEMMKNMMI